MPHPYLRYLDQCINDRESLTRLRAALDRIEKCCAALDRKLNLADVLREPANYAGLLKVFGDEELEIGVMLTLNIALKDYEVKTFTLRNEIQGEKKFEFLHRFVGGWKQFDSVVCFQIPGRNALFLNPLKKEQWLDVDILPAGTLVTVFVKSVHGKRSRSQEALAAERFEAVFDTVQNRLSNDEANPALVVQFGQFENGASPQGRSNGNGTNGHGKTARVAGKTPAPGFKKPVKSSAPSIKRTFGVISAGGPLSLSFRVVVNKMDTFVHAGNAQLILGHIRDYAGRVEMFVLRAEKKKVQMDADSIWSAEIRNGETVLFEFYGPRPTEEFVKELAKKVNKYTQMDKLVNE